MRPVSRFCITTSLSANACASSPLALRSSAERVYQRARQFFTVAEISEAFAAARGIALPSQLRHAIRADGRELHEEFLQLLPRRPAPIRVQRWSTRDFSAKWRGALSLRSV